MRICRFYLVTTVCVKAVSRAQARGLAMRAKLEIPDALERDEIEAAVKATRTKGLVIPAAPQRAPT